MRLSLGATLLARTDKRIKEIWVEIGYNHGSNFDHDFKRHFRISPREYRARVIRPGLVQRHGANGSAPPAADRSHQPGATVLVVDDDDITSQTIAQDLALQGYTARVASTGNDGLLETERLAVDVILLDYHLPDMDGLEWLRRLRDRASAHSPAVIVFTADWDVERDAADIHALGGSIVSKLCDLDEVVTLIAAQDSYGSIACR